MITISLCMIVKNEEAILARCLDSVADLMDEIIIVDTGSEDRTKEIARRYTDQVYDYVWEDDFADARNFSFSKATMDYIYVPDADEVLDEANHRAFALLKQAMQPEIEIVQMKYCTQQYNTVLNAKTEYRPKLFKRLREFTWIDAIHETVRTAPVVFDSDVEILHLPQGMHQKRDFGIFVRTIQKQGGLSDKLHNMYARELLKTGSVEDLREAEAYFTKIYETEMCSENDAARRQQGACVLARTYRLDGQRQNDFFKVALKEMAQQPCAEICYELGRYFADGGDYGEAALWFYNAAYETSCILDIHTGGDLALQGLVECYQSMLDQTDAKNPARDVYQQQLEGYREALQQWALPEE